jgi:hypothetical protein
MGAAAPRFCLGYGFPSVHVLSFPMESPGTYGSTWYLKGLHTMNVCHTSIWRSARCLLSCGGHQPEDCPRPAPGCACHPRTATAISGPWNDDPRVSCRIRGRFRLASEARATALADPPAPVSARFRRPTQHVCCRGVPSKTGRERTGRRIHTFCDIRANASKGIIRVVP